ncbi:MAG: type II toxin-antitoxin system HicA family toxin [Candidatus Obscuribacterales bacterium]|nr:type II toxin-antitoxin system HicA family toxin [Candidatus Obscuribacterales bacterium]
MRLPRDVSSKDLVAALKAFGYEVTRQTGSHIRLTTTQGGEHHLIEHNFHFLDAEPVGACPISASSF